MTLDLWLAFALASTVLLAIPGPTVLLVVLYALAAETLRERLKRLAVISRINRCGGAALMAMGAVTVFARRA